MMRAIEFQNISRYRSALMGFAMIIIVFFHVGNHRHDTIPYCFACCGNLGVDIFLFLSGMGLWHSFTHSPILKRFYWRRFIRIYPAWMLIAGGFYIQRFVQTGSNDWTMLIGNLLFGYGFWHHLDLNFWYIPATIALYLVAPFYIRLINRTRDYCWLPVAFIVLCFLLQYFKPLHSSLGYLEIFTSRIPIFLIGVNCGLLVKQNRKMEANTIWLLLIVFALSLTVCVNFENGLRRHFPLFLERMIYIPLTATSVLLISHILRSLPGYADKALAFVGAISLEIYLIHEHHVHCYLTPLHLGYWLTLLPTLAISIVLAYCAHWIIGKLIINNVKK